TLQEETTLATTLPVQETVSYKLDNEELSRYIKALVKNTKDKLPNDVEVSEETGIRLNTCKAYRRELKNTSYHGSSLIDGKRGYGTVANYPARTIIKLMTMNREMKNK
ncbi:MAG: hypothetical protein PF569_01540, partial [Candidatus Woesearchaeota archaeon]|nr:hypothetical protein [Candidatus Woesearchaeota archaeon]